MFGYQGKNYTAKELAAVAGVSYPTMWRRLCRDRMPVELAIAKQKGKHHHERVNRHSAG